MSPGDRTSPPPSGVRAPRRVPRPWYAAGSGTGCRPECHWWEVREQHGFGVVGAQPPHPAHPAPELAPGLTERLIDRRGPDRPPHQPRAPALMARRSSRRHDRTGLPRLCRAGPAGGPSRKRQKGDSGGGRLDLPREDDDLVDEAPPQMDDVRSRQAGASIRRGEDPLVPGPLIRHVHR
jgi:hypothetical protein